MRYLIQRGVASVVDGVASTLIGYETLSQIMSDMDGRATLELVFLRRSSAARYVIISTAPSYPIEAKFVLEGQPKSGSYSQKACIAARALADSVLLPLVQIEPADGPDDQGDIELWSSEDEPYELYIEGKGFSSATAAALQDAILYNTNPVGFFE